MPRSPEKEKALCDRLIDLAARYRVEQEEHAEKAGYRGEHAEKAALLDRVVVDLEAVLCLENPPTASEHSVRQIRQNLKRGSR